MVVSSLYVRNANVASLLPPLARSRRAGLRSAQAGANGRAGYHGRVMLALPVCAQGATGFRGCWVPP